MTKTTDIPLSTFASAEEALDLGSQQISNLAAPTLDADAATKQYVDEATSSIRGVVTKNAPATLSNAEVLGGLVLITAAVAITLPAAASGNEGADLYLSATDAATLVCTAGFHGGGAGDDTLTFAANEGCHVYSDGTNWYLLGAGPGCALT
jgi:hypothetical protein